MVQYSVTGLPKTTCMMFISPNSHSCLHAPTSHHLHSVLTHFGSTSQTGLRNSDPTEKVTAKKGPHDIFWSDKLDSSPSSINAACTRAAYEEGVAVMGGGASHSA